MRRTRLDVYLIGLDAPGSPRAFYAAPAPPSAEDDPVDAEPSAGLRGRFGAWLARLKADVRRSDGAAARFGRRAWDWLHSRVHPDELLLARLRSASDVHLHFPASVAPGEATAAWSAFLGRGRTRHWLRLAGNACVAPLTILLAPVPGPNVVGYWFVYRALHHWRILAGLGRARGGAVPVELRPTEVLDRPVAPGDTDHLTWIGCEPAQVDAFLGRVGVRPRAGAVPVPGV